MTISTGEPSIINNINNNSSSSNKISTAKVPGDDFVDVSAD